MDKIEDFLVNEVLILPVEVSPQIIYKWRIFVQWVVSHHTPPVAPYDQLSSLATPILSAPFGSLYEFSPTDYQTYTNPHDVSDAITQQVEYIVRGHSALIPGSLWEVVVAEDDMMMMVIMKMAQTE